MTKTTNCFCLNDHNGNPIALLTEKQVAALYNPQGVDMLKAGEYLVFDNAGYIDVNGVRIICDVGYHITKQNQRPLYRDKQLDAGDMYWDDGTE